MDKGKINNRDNGHNTFTPVGTVGYSLNQLEDLDDDVDEGVLDDDIDDEELDLDNNEVDLSENYFSLENFPNYDQAITQLTSQSVNRQKSNEETTRNQQNFMPDEKDYYLEDKENNGGWLNLNCG